MDAATFARYPRPRVPHLITLNNCQLKGLRYYVRLKSWHHEI